MDAYDLYTDGSVQPNPGPAGWAAHFVPKLAANLESFSISGSFRMSTISRMELMALARGLEFLHGKVGPCIVLVYTDSKYVRNMFERGWLDHWMRNGWMTATGTRVQNRDLIEPIQHYRGIHRVRIHWVPSHSGIAGNEDADRLAVQARVTQADQADDLPYLQRLAGEDGLFLGEPVWE